MFRQILVPLDGSPLAECVLPHVAALGKAFDADVTLLHVLPESSSAGRMMPVDPLEWQASRAGASMYLDDKVELLGAQGVKSSPVLLEGHPPQRILEHAHEHGVDLIVLSSHGKDGLSGWNLASVAQKTVLRSRVSTLVVRAYRAVRAEPGEPAYRRVLVPLDGSQRAECAISPATSLAGFLGAELVLAHIRVRPRPYFPRQGPVRPEDTELIEGLVERQEGEAQQYFDRLKARLPIPARTRIAFSEQAAVALYDVIREEQADLVVMSAHGHTGTTRWPHGRTTTHFLLYGATHLLIVQDLAPNQCEPTEAEQAAAEVPGH